MQILRIEKNCLKFILFCVKNQDSDETDKAAFKPTNGEIFTKINHKNAAFRPFGVK